MGLHQWIISAGQRLGTAHVVCEAIHCAQYFSVILFVRQILLCDMAYIGEHADGDVLTVYMLRREIEDPSVGLRHTASYSSSSVFR